MVDVTTEIDNYLICVHPDRLCEHPKFLLTKFLLRNSNSRTIFDKLDEVHREMNHGLSRLLTIEACQKQSYTLGGRQNRGPRDSTSQIDKTEYPGKTVGLVQVDKNLFHFIKLNKICLVSLSEPNDSLAENNVAQRMDHNGYSIRSDIRKAFRSFGLSNDVAKIKPTENVFSFLSPKEKTLFEMRTSQEDIPRTKVSLVHNGLFLVLRQDEINSESLMNNNKAESIL